MFVFVVGLCGFLWGFLVLGGFFCSSKQRTASKQTKALSQTAPSSIVQGGTDSQEVVVEELSQSHEQLGESSYCQSLSAPVNLKRVS